MASKSKKRRRVLGASCILAALIIAGSSFAWFTSKDEVTNRLTANSDYGVSIVESFVPPKNMLPGQTINKDVYAVNTGTIDAFVKETVKGVLNYDYEVLVNDFDAKLEKLTVAEVEAIQGQVETEDGIKTYEAGGFLAWTDATTTTTAYSYDADKDPLVVGTEDGTLVKGTYAAKDENTADKTFTYKLVLDGKTYYGVESGGNLDGATLYEVTKVGDDYTYNSTADTKLTLTKKETTTTYPTGSINNGRTQDVNDTAAGTDNPGVPSPVWKPTVEGAYVFRRAINKGNATNPFTYAGYYYVPAHTETVEGNEVTVPEAYYKIVLGDDSDKFPATKVGNNYVFDITADSKDLVTDVATDIDADTGEIEDTVSYKFIELKNSGNQPVTLEFESATTGTDAHPARLVAEYTTAVTAEGDRYDAKAEAARAQVAYENALGKYEAAVDSLKNAQANADYGQALAKAENDLYLARKALEDAYSANSDSQTDYDAKKSEVNDYATDMEDGSKNLVGNNGILNKTGDSNAINDDLQDGMTSLKPSTGGLFTANELDAYSGSASNNQYVAALQDENSAYHKAFANYEKIFKEIYGTVGDGTGGLYKEVADLLDAVQASSAAAAAYDSTTANAHIAKAKADELVAKAQKLVDKMKALRQAYAELKDVENNVTGLELSDEVTDTAQRDVLDDFVTIATNFKSNADTLSGLVDDYLNAEDQYKADNQALANEVSDWKQAIDDYNTAVTTAKTNYEATLKAVNNTGNSTTGTGTSWDNHTEQHVSEDKSKPIVPTYSARTDANYTDPAFSNAEATALKGYDGNGTLPTSPTSMSKIAIVAMAQPSKDADNFKATDYVGVEPVTAPADRNSNGEKTVTEWENAVAGYKEALKTASKNYSDAKAAVAGASTIKFYINLADQYADDWTMDPETDKTPAVDFYLNKILVGGETSGKLIDSVTFDKDVTPADYKNLTFDIDVALDSIQVAYDANQRGYTTETVNDVDNFAMEATVVDPETQGSDVVWNGSDTTAASTVSYKIQTGTTGAGTEEDPEVPVYEYVTLTSIDETVDGTKYTWKFTYNEKEYYGTSRNNGTVFGKYTAATTEPVADATVDTTTDKFTLVATRTTT